MINANTPDNKAQPVEQEKLIRLYAAQFEKEPSALALSSMGDLPVAVSGEMVIARPIDNAEVPVVEAVHRLALWTEPVEELGGSLALAGLVNELKFEPGSKGSVEPFEMRLYYPLLGQLAPACEESDAEYPQLETLRGRLIWELEDSGDEKLFRLRITLVLDQMVDPPLGVLKQLTFGPTMLAFQLLEDPKDEAPEHHSLSACTGSPLPSVSGNQHNRLKLKLRFVNFSTIRSASNLEPLAQDLVAGACEVWWIKAGIRIDPEYSGPDAAPGISIVARPNPQYSTLDYAEETGPNGPPTVYRASDTDAVEIYLVDHLNGDATHPRTGGGITHLCGTNDAYVILEIGKAENNHYLLAHELGHVLGLTHPGETPSTSLDCDYYVEGSACSIMTPDSPNSRRNTLNNLNVLGHLPLGGVLRLLPTNQGGGVCRWSYEVEQGFFHIVRDFPYDDGTEPSVPRPPAGVWWTHSDVWNSNQGPLAGSNPNNKYADGTDMFNADYSPRHREPSYTGPNRMYTRIHICQALTQTVKVYLYIAVPGSTSEPLRPLLNPNRPTPQHPNDPSLVFQGISFPHLGEPKTMELSWSAVGYPPNCCVFAVAKSTSDTSPLIDNITTSPDTHRFYDLFSLLASDNDVAQRNLHIQQTNPGNPRPISTTLAWVQIDNPFDQAASAKLEIDATQAASLSSLSLEVDERIVDKITLGEAATTIHIADSLQPGEHRILRFRAALPLGLPDGMELPIHLRFIVNDQLINGYTHVVRVAPLSTAVAQVLDSLYGAFRDVEVGLEFVTAPGLADQVRAIILETRGIKSPLGCWGLIWNILQLRPRHWSAGLRNLARPTAVLAQSLEKLADVGSEALAIRRHLYELAGVLLTAEETSSALFIERVRDLADRIQEPAGRLARRRL